MSIETSKILGGIGALLMFIGVIPYVNYFGVIELIGLILVMVALYGLGSYYKEGGIFNNALYGLIMGIVGGVVSVAVVIVVILSSLTDFLYTLFPDWNGDWTALSGLTPNTSNISLNGVCPSARLFISPSITQRHDIRDKERPSRQRTVNYIINPISVHMVKIVIRARGQERRYIGRR